MGPLEARREDRLQLGLAVAVLVAQQQDLAQLRQGEEHIAIGGHCHPARIAETARELIDAEARWQPEGRRRGTIDEIGDIGNGIGGIGGGKLAGIDLEPLPRRLARRLGHRCPPEWQRQQQQGCEREKKAGQGAEGHHFYLSWHAQPGFQSAGFVNSQRISAATPGRVLPSSHSRKAPPAVET